MCRLRGGERRRGAHVQSGRKWGGRGLANTWSTRDTKKQGCCRSTFQYPTLQATTLPSSQWQDRLTLGCSQRIRGVSCPQLAIKVKNERIKQLQKQLHSLHSLIWQRTQQCFWTPFAFETFIELWFCICRLTSCFWMLHMLSRRFSYDWSIIYMNSYISKLLWILNWLPICNCQRMWRCWNTNLWNLPRNVIDVYWGWWSCPMSWIDSHAVSKYVYAYENGNIQNISAFSMCLCLRLQFCT